MRIKETFEKKEAINKVIKFMEEIIDELYSKEEHIVNYSINRESNYNYHYGIIQKIDGYSVNINFGIDCNHTGFYERYNVKSKKFFPIVKMKIYGRRNTYTNLNIKNILFKINELLNYEIRKEKKRNIAQQARKKQDDLFEKAKNSVEVLGNNVSEFRTHAGVVSRWTDYKIKLISELTIEELQKINDLICEMRK